MRIANRLQYVSQPVLMLCLPAALFAHCLRYLSFFSFSLALLSVFLLSLYAWQFRCNCWIILIDCAGDGDWFSLDHACKRHLHAFCPIVPAYWKLKLVSEDIKKSFSTEFRLKMRGKSWKNQRNKHRKNKQRYKTENWMKKKKHLTRKCGQSKYRSNNQA